MKPPAASPGRAEKPQLPAPPGLARLLLSKSRRAGGRSRRAPPATSPMFVSRGRGRAGADGEPSSPKVTCIGQVRMRKAKKKNSNKKKAPDKDAKGYCRCLKKAFLCGGMFEFDRRRRRRTKEPPPPPPPTTTTMAPEVERGSRRSPWVFSSRDVAVAAAPKPVDARSGKGAEDDDDETGAGTFFRSVGREGEPGANDAGGEKEPQPVSSATTTPPKNALLLMRCRSAPQNRASPLTSRFPVASPSPSEEIAAVHLSPSPRRPDKASTAPSPSPGKADRFSPAPSPSPRRKSEKVLADDEAGEQRQGAFAVQEQAEEEEMMRCSSARPLVLQRCKSEPATTGAAKMAGGPAADATTGGCFWANGGSSGRRRHPAAVVALTGH